MSNTPDLASSPPVTELLKTSGGLNRIGEVKSWLASQFNVAGKDHCKTLLENFGIIAARIREILENVGLAQEGLPANVVASSQVLANVANLRNIRDTELSSFLVAMGDVSLTKTGVEDKRAKVQKESKILLDYTWKAIAKLTYLKRTLAQLEDDVAPCETQMDGWKTNLAILVSKERQSDNIFNNILTTRIMQNALKQAMLNRVGYTPEISHGMLAEMAEHRKNLDKKTKPILDTLRSYQDLPPDKALAALAIEDKKRQYNAAEKYLEDVLQSALATSED
ncbi:hypothetical protein QVD17_22529 [Tagetes erecta]|uniref:Uncharacterized protein n=1 Tax=Tagetes erecta TaxID=13708 RepID=A0AAD8KG60_TARER|nr:hypothetical protein QVD17_22529 [Tagetes erecta]